MSLEILNELKALEDAEGRLTPEAVVEAARDPESALNGCFEWDDSAAAHAHRIDQARTLIRNCRVEVTVSNRTIRTIAYIHDPELETGEQGYRSIKELQDERDNAHAAVTAEFGRAAANLRRAREIALVLGWSPAEIDKLLQELGILREKVEAATTKMPPPSKPASRRSREKMT